ncbi:MAG: 1-deoxy-D-xylulose-5-phosphate reductoisomerase [Phycisphaeraceae bacterium]|nr:1-deoxy-D-xylulose-5-phosphate reductoisomerase [Phycisphaeraceae bacterium]
MNPAIRLQPSASIDLAPTGAQQRRLVVLGSTGSIGSNTLEVVEHLNDQAQSCGLPPIDVVGLAAGNRVDRLVEQALACGCRMVAVADVDKASYLREHLPGVEVLAGADAAERLVRTAGATDVCAAVVGSAGLGGTLAAIEMGLTVHLANKETLVAAGALVQELLERTHAHIIPVDSEHSAIFQCLQSRGTEAVRRVVLTASGGPFRTWSRQAIRAATVEQALCHPTWNMGPKITIDSATMMNKALEIIEAHWLFGLDASCIDVIIHPQSIVHSFVEFADHSVLAQIGPPDMKTPIQYALTWPRRVAGSGPELDWSSLRQLVFEPLDRDRFPSIELAYDVVRAGGTAGAVMNAANEAAVGAFLERRIEFGAVFDLVAQALDTIPIQPARSLEAVLAADQASRRWVEQRIASR